MLSSCCRGSIMLFLLAVLSSTRAQLGAFRRSALQDDLECTDINDCRRLFDIVWGCLVTIFLCIWVSVHPNVPPPRLARPQNAAGFLKLAEMAGCRQEWAAAASAEAHVWLEFALLQVLTPPLDYGVSLTHGFFIVMGGFVDVDEHPIVTKEQLSTPNVVQEIHAVKESDIDDKSKGDLFSKGIALCQGLWFIAQCIARRLQRLPLTSLEVATLSFAVLNALTWLFWLGKPLDVRNQIKLPVRTSPPNHTASPPYPASASWLDRFLSVFGNAYHEADYDPLSNTAVPTFWCTTVSNYIDIRSSTRAHWLSWTLTDAIPFLSGTLFGGIHCLAWRAAFPSPAEMWLWRSSALVLTVAPPVFLAASLLYTISPEGMLGFVGVYSVARGILLVLPLSALRLLPLEAFRDVDWSVYIPHL
ncbi:hypothetical protein MIND_00178300 [Mycena indigotica]|uniref:Transmembrane protein n=1 Tax=Mycena indigotica TaxID=2126181 RepID=A0A8H6TIY9_9AGAR|nr:uncharacterized protein MIND_00178300 [Mycena indigotica]KAF7316585.1 hypothetical protein MIND_00178300 [Mycena indigotica]